jgi:hypothetical protein
MLDMYEDLKKVIKEAWTDKLHGNADLLKHVLDKYFSKLSNPSFHVRIYSAISICDMSSLSPIPYYFDLQPFFLPSSSYRQHHLSRS